MASADRTHRPCKMHDVRSCAYCTVAPTQMSGCPACYRDGWGQPMYVYFKYGRPIQPAGYATSVPEKGHRLEPAKAAQATTAVISSDVYPGDAHLLKIPAELRLVIYSMIDPHKKPSQGVEVRPTMAFRTRRSSKAIAFSTLSLTCKRIHSEVKDFYREHVQTTIDVGIFAGHRKECFPRQMSPLFNVHFARLRSLDLHVTILPLMTQSQMFAMVGWLEHLIATLRMSEHLATFRFEVRVSGRVFTSKEMVEGDFRSLKWQALDEFGKTLPIISRSASPVS